MAKPSRICENVHMTWSKVSSPVEKKDTSKAAPIMSHELLVSLSPSYVPRQARKPSKARSVVPMKNSLWTTK
eukprot:CAMPEP_0198565634 /NCGR_PEP_ID=MMETSP1462-20131121/102077_1 /TAXON_ID=1333877 /ORGANISM="Brandtodinium nutriculum, Strain RCC3387" /LENGTH=71 /DNA_ID=CAMNT_0044296635 /DNA_START=275 /DNA_END=490 /DNA_ORIENTATION=-